MAHGRGENAATYGGYGTGGGDSLFGGIDGGVDCFNRSAIAGRLGSCGFGKRWARPSGGATDTLLWNVGGWRSGRASFSHPYYNQAKLV